MQKLKLRSQWKDFGVFCLLYVRQIRDEERTSDIRRIIQENIFISKRVKNTEQGLRYIYRIHIKDVTCIYKWSSSHI